MAGDWIKVEHVTPDKQEVIELARLLRIDQDAVVGKLLRIWIWADQHSVDGNDLSVTDQFIDRVTSRSGFADALRRVGWLSGPEGHLKLPNFDRHNGTTAKTRGLTNRRVLRHRNARDACNGASVTSALPDPLPEKRREEKDQAINRLRVNRSCRVEDGEENGENAFLQRCLRVMGKAEMEKNGAGWRSYYRQNPDKCDRVIAEVESVMTERPATIRKTVGAFAMDLWKRWK